MKNNLVKATVLGAVVGIGGYFHTNIGKLMDETSSDVSSVLIDEETGKVILNRANEEVKYPCEEGKKSISIGGKGFCLTSTYDGTSVLVREYTKKECTEIYPNVGSSIPDIRCEQDGKYFEAYEKPKEKNDKLCFTKYSKGFYIFTVRRTEVKSLTEENQPCIKK